MSKLEQNSGFLESPTHKDDHAFGHLTSTETSRQPSLSSKSPSLNEDGVEQEEESEGSEDADIQPAYPPKAITSQDLRAPLPALERAGPSEILRSSFDFGAEPTRQLSIVSQNGTEVYPPRAPKTEEHEGQNGQSGSAADLSAGPSPGLDPPATHPRTFLEGKSRLFKAIFVSTTCSAQLICQAQFGMVIMPLKEIGDYLGVTSPGELSWMTASYGLTVGMFLISSGRLGDLYGPKLLWLLGYALMIVSNIASGFCTTRIPFDICRALAGIGAALALPNAVAILGRTYPPGPTRSLVFAILGALGPGGWMLGGAFASLLADTATVPWIWFSTAIFAVAFASVGWLVLPPDDNLAPASARREYDYLGTLLVIMALGLFNFAWNQAPLVGWSAPYVWSLLLAAVLSFVALYFWEKRLGRNALIPTEVLSRTSLLVYLCLWLGWMSFGVFLYYTTLFIRNIRGVPTALGLAAQLSPLTPMGILCALFVPTLLVRFAGHQIFFTSMVFFLIGDLMAAVAPAHGSYWSVTFLSLILVVIGPDLSFSTGQLIVSNSVDREFQGIAGGLVSMITNYSLSIGLGMAGTVEAYAVPDGPILKGYRYAFYFGCALATVAVVVVGLFVRMPKMAQYRE